ncbi:MAG: hypothetical protein K1563_09135 [Candidatus Thiodiazotropha sp. (ex. Lucinisca nassula)]|nr:hypothetical protein [Candidatus Thiodiazotropha sp. (ex. Lucinisca nassula)]MBW9273839.1 hypothetical protein [Candidatus Thiodiazotropha sp. (ex. Lucinisca nassula)]
MPSNNNSDGKGLSNHMLVFIGIVGSVIGCYFGYELGSAMELAGKCHYINRMPCSIGAALYIGMFGAILLLAFAVAVTSVKTDPGQKKKPGYKTFLDSLLIAAVVIIVYIIWRVTR